MIEFRIVPVTKWAIVEHRTEYLNASVETIAEVRDKDRAERLAQSLADKYGGTVTLHDEG